MQNLSTRRPQSRKFVDHTGKRLGTLTAISFAGFQGKFPKWRCRCDCGRTRTIFAHNFGREGAYRVCRCIPKTRDEYLYAQWRLRIRHDCCPEWKDFRSFGDSIGHRPKRKYLSKRRLAEPWSPENSTWVGNDRKFRASLFEFNGKSQTVREWCDELKISRQRLHQRINSGMPKERVFAARGGLPQSIRSNSFAALFDWDSIADGKRHRLVRGKDFQCNPNRLERSLNYWAKKNKAQMSIEIQPRSILVRIKAGRRSRHRE
jgi:hypothetical protein